jgi:Aspartyl/Asparaginyl beta-hydroxylase
MKLSEPLVRLCEYDIGDIARALPDASSPVWDFDKSRQTGYPVHRLTRSILFEWLDNDWQIGGPVTVRSHHYAPTELSAAAYACTGRLAQSYPGGKLVRMTLAELPAGGKIPAHIDNGLGVTAVHRCHVPIVTSREVHFYIDRISHYLECGIAYEFDNTRLHAVDNKSGQRRVHLMFDFMPAMLLV